VTLAQSSVDVYTPSTLSHQYTSSSGTVSRTVDASTIS